MPVNKPHLILILTILVLAIFLNGATPLKWKPMTFDNPGSKRLLKTGEKGYYYFRSLPEKSMLLNVSGLTAVEIRAISKTKLDKPQFILKYSDKKVSYDLKFTSEAVSKSGNLYLYEPVRITLPAGVDKLELLSYNNNLYFRSFQPVQKQAKKPPVPPLMIMNRLSEYTLSNELNSHKYYAFGDSGVFSFQVNKDRAFSLYVRAQLTGKQIPVFELYENGQLLQKVQLSLKRTKTYKAEGLINLTIGKRMDFTPKNKAVKYELKSVSGHLFLARPVILKKK